MTESIVVLVPVLVLAVVTLFAFAGCSSFGTAPSTTTPGTGTGTGTGTQPGPQTPPVTTPAPEPYRDAVLLDKSLRAYWRLGDAAGAPAADSVPQKKHPGSYLPGASSATPGVLKLGKGPDEGCGVFDGTQGYVAVPFHEDYNPPLSFSVEAWIRPQLSAQGRYVVVGCYQKNPDQGFALGVRQNAAGEQTATAWVADGTASFEAETELGVATQHDGWRQLVMTYDRLNQVLTLYVRDGIQLFTDTKSGAGYASMKDANARELRIGAGRNASDAVRELFPGRIDEVAIYDRVLDAGTIGSHFTLAVTP